MFSQEDPNETIDLSFNKSLVFELMTRFKEIKTRLDKKPMPLLKGVVKTMMDARRVMTNWC